MYVRGLAILATDRAVPFRGAVEERPSGHGEIHAADGIGFGGRGDRNGCGEEKDCEKGLHDSSDRRNFIPGRHGRQRRLPRLAARFLGVSSAPPPRSSVCVIGDTPTRRRGRLHVQPARRQRSVCERYAWRDGALASRRRIQISARRNRNAFVITETELKLIASAAIIGLRRRPKTGYSTPAAIGTPRAL